MRMHRLSHSILEEKWERLLTTTTPPHSHCHLVDATRALACKLSSRRPGFNWGRLGFGVLRRRRSTAAGACAPMVGRVGRRHEWDF